MQGTQSKRLNLFLSGIQIFANATNSVLITWVTFRLLPRTIVAQLYFVSFSDALQCMQLQELRCIYLYISPPAEYIIKSSTFPMYAALRIAMYISQHLTTDVCSSEEDLSSDAYPTNHHTGSNHWFRSGNLDQIRPFQQQPSLMRMIGFEQICPFQSENGTTIRFHHNLNHWSFQCNASEWVFPVEHLMWWTWKRAKTSPITALMHHCSCAKNSTPIVWVDYVSSGELPKWLEEGK